MIPMKAGSVTPSEKIAELISAYLVGGMNHMTPEGRKQIQTIVIEAQKFPARSGTWKDYIK